MIWNQILNPTDILQTGIHYNRCAVTWVYQHIRAALHFAPPHAHHLAVLMRLGLILLAQVGLAITAQAVQMTLTGGALLQQL